RVGDKRFERCQIEATNRAGFRLVHQRAQNGQKARKSLPCACWGTQEEIVTSCDRGPGQSLGMRWLPISPRKPRAHPLRKHCEGMGRGRRQTQRGEKVRGSPCHGMFPEWAQTILGKFVSCGLSSERSAIAS